MKIDLQAQVMQGNHTIKLFRYPASLLILGTSPEVAQPRAVRYAYAFNPEGRNLYNREGLPASPFTTEN